MQHQIDRVCDIITADVIPYKRFRKTKAKKQKQINIFAINLKTYPKSFPPAFYYFSNKNLIFHIIREASKIRKNNLPWRIRLSKNPPRS